MSRFGLVEGEADSLRCFRLWECLCSVEETPVVLKLVITASIRCHHSAHAAPKTNSNEIQLRLKAKEQTKYMRPRAVSEKRVSLVKRQLDALSP